MWFKKRISPLTSFDSLAYRYLTKIIVQYLIPDPDSMNMNPKHCIFSRLWHTEERKTQLCRLPSGIRNISKGTGPGLTTSNPMQHFITICLIFFKRTFLRLVATAIPSWKHQSLKLSNQRPQLALGWVTIQVLKWMLQ